VTTALHRYHYYAGPGFHLGHGTAGVIAVIVIGYLVLHVLGGLLHHGARRRRGHRVNVGWSLFRGPWASCRIFGGTYYHRL
jgi:hypothetical protein